MKSLMRSLRDHWIIILAAAGACVAWGSQTTQTAYVGTSVDKVLVEVRSIATDVAAIKATATATTADILDLRARVGRVEARR